MLKPIWKYSNFVSTAHFHYNFRAKVLLPRFHFLMHLTPFFGVDVDSSQVCKITEGLSGKVGLGVSLPLLSLTPSQPGQVWWWMVPKDGDATMPPGPNPGLSCFPTADLFPSTLSVFALLHVFCPDLSWPLKHVLFPFLLHLIAPAGLPFTSFLITLGRGDMRLL